MTSYQFLPPLTSEEREALRESIATFGVLQPVIRDESGAILDGHHRAEIADELGVECPSTILSGLSEEQKVEQALVLNLGRRHLDDAAKAHVVGELRAHGLSLRWISEKTGIPKTTVARIASGVPLGTPEYVGGRDGKRYQASVPRPTPRQVEAAESARFRAELVDCGLEEFEVGPVTVQELREFLRHGLPSIGLDWHIPEDDPRLPRVLYDILVGKGAMALVRTGRLPLVPSYIEDAWFEPDEKARPKAKSPAYDWASGSDAVWRIMVEARAGSFFTFLDAIGIDPWKKKRPAVIDKMAAGALACFVGFDQVWSYIGEAEIEDVLPDAERTRLARLLMGRHGAAS